ncbi:MAG: sigma-70 family RNA polymerase sigma factor [Candidatus Levybacteria bacterium]|nr:sigma-70 family RNA polymerase sigma factor [Candidatus Levybacteria bacterium]
MSKHELQPGLEHHKFAVKPFRPSGVILNESSQDTSRVSISSLPNSDVGVVRRRENLGGDQHAIRNGLIFQARETGIINTLTERQRDVINLIHPEEGLPSSLRKIGRQMGGISREAVAKLRDKAYKKLDKAIPSERPPIKKTPAMTEIENKHGRPIEQILLDYASRGFSRREIGQKLGKSHRVIGDWCDKFGIEIKISEPIRSTKLKDVERRYGKPINEVLYNEYWGKNRSLPEIAGKLEIKIDTVIKWMKAAGIPLRTKKEAAQLVFSDSKKRKRILRRTKKMRQKISESVKRYHQKKRGSDQPSV